MSWKKLILWLLALTFCLVGGVLIWAFHTDLGRFQPEIEAFLSEQLDRETRFDELSIDLGSSIEIRARGFRIANVPGAAHPDLVNIPSLEGALLLSSLFDPGPLVVERLEAEGVQVNLAWDEDGAGNFQLGKPEADPPVSQPPRTQALLSLRQSRLENASLSLAWPTHENLLEFRTLEVADSANDMITLSFDGVIDGDPMGFAGKVGPRQELWEAGAVLVEGEGHFSGLTVKGSADIDSLSRPDRPIVSLDIQGDDIRKIETLLGMEPGPPGDYHLLLDTSLEVDRWTLDLRGHIGEVVYDANGRAGGLQHLEQVGLNISAKGPDMGNILRLFRIDDLREEPFELQGRVTRQGPVLRLENIDMDLGSTRFDLDGTLNNFPHLQGAEIELTIRGDDIESFRELLGLPGAADGPFSLDLNFQAGAGTGEGPGVYDRLSLQLDTNLGSLAIQGNVSGDERYAGSTLDVDFDGTNAAAFLGEFGVPGLGPSPYTADARLEIRQEGLFFQDLKLTGLYDVAAEARGLVGWDPLASDSDIDIELEGQDLAGTLLPLGVEWPLASAPFRLSSGVRATSAGLRLDGLVFTAEQSRLEADALVPLRDDLAGLDITLRAEGPELGNVFRPGDALDVPPGAWSLASHVRRADGRLLLENTQVTVADVELTGEASLPWPIDGGNGSFRLEGQGPDVTTLLPRLGGFELASQPFTLSAEARVEAGIWRMNPSSLTLGTASLDLSGTAGRMNDGAKSDLDLVLDVPNLGALGTWRGEPVGDARFSLETRLHSEGPRLSADPLQLKTGASLATGKLLWDSSATVPQVEVELASEQLDLRQILPEPGTDEDSTAPDRDPPSDGRLIPDFTLPLDWLDRVEGSLDLTVGQLILHDRQIFDIRLDASLREGLLILDPYRAKGITGDIEVTGQLRRRDDGKAEVTVDFDATDLLPSRADWQNADPATLPGIDAMLDARAEGATLRELAASLNGRLRAVASEGTLPGDGLRALDTYVLEQIFEVLVPGATTREPTTVKCFAANVVIQDGVVTPEPLVALRTDKLLILAAGSIDLRDERLRLQFQTTPSKLLGASLMELVNPFVSIEGTLAKPSPNIDPGRTIVYGGAAAATAGLSIVAKGLWDRLRGAQKPCEQLRDALLEEAQNE